MAKKSGAKRYGNPAKRRPVTGDLARLVQPTGNIDPRTVGGDMLGPGGPHERNAVFLDTTDAVIMQGVDVSVMEAVRGGRLDGPAIYMLLRGRVNNTTRQVQAGYMFPGDGAAAIISELIGLADRAGDEMREALVQRLAEQSAEGTADLRRLRVAINQAIQRADNAAG